MKLINRVRSLFECPPPILFPTVEELQGNPVLKEIGFGSKRLPKEWAAATAEGRRRIEVLAEAARTAGIANLSVNPDGTAAACLPAPLNASDGRMIPMPTYQGQHITLGIYLAIKYREAKRRGIALAVQGKSVGVAEWCVRPHDQAYWTNPPDFETSGWEGWGAFRPLDEVMQATAVVAPPVPKFLLLETTQRYEQLARELEARGIRIINRALARKKQILQKIKSLDAEAVLIEQSGGCEPAAVELARRRAQKLKGEVARLRRAILPSDSGYEYSLFDELERWRPYARGWGRCIKLSMPLSDYQYSDYRYRGFEHLSVGLWKEAERLARCWENGKILSNGKVVCESTVHQWSSEQKVRIVVEYKGRHFLLLKEQGNKPCRQRNGGYSKHPYKKVRFATDSLAQMTDEELRAIQARG